MDIILKYFPNLNSVQKQRFEQLLPLYAEWNSQINVISRKDFSKLYERHVLHSLGIAKFIRFRPDSKILDVGTGGGFREYLWQFILNGKISFGRFNWEKNKSCK